MNINDNRAGMGGYPSFIGRRASKARRQWDKQQRGAMARHGMTVCEVRARVGWAGGVVVVIIGAAGLKEKREELGLSVGKVAKAADIRTWRLRKVEKGEEPVTPAVVAAYEKALGVDRDSDIVAVLGELESEIRQVRETLRERVERREGSQVPPDTEAEAEAADAGSSKPGPGRQS